MVANKMCYVCVQKPTCILAWSIKDAIALKRDMQSLIGEMLLSMNVRPSTWHCTRSEQMRQWQNNWTAFRFNYMGQNKFSNSLDLCNPDCRHCWKILAVCCIAVPCLSALFIWEMVMFDEIKSCISSLGGWKIVTWWYTCPIWKLV